MRVFRRRILKVPNPRTWMLCCCLSASLTASRNASTTRAQSFLEIIGPAVLAIEAVTCSTRSALVMRPPDGLQAAERRAPYRPLLEVKGCVSRGWGGGGVFRAGGAAWNWRRGGERRGGPGG